MKKNGAQILKEIDKKIFEMRAHVKDLSDQISASQSKKDKLDQEEAKLYFKLASLRLELVEGGSIQSQIISTEKNVKNILEQRQNARLDLDHQLKINQTEQDEIEKERMKVAKLLEDFVDEINSKENKVRAKLLKENSYKKNIADIKSLEIQIARTDQKIQTAQDDYDEKTQPYRNDPLFMYLWDKGYNTSAYKASSFIRYFDNWVAQVVKYEPARRNYAMLSTIPEKLIRHQEILEERIDNLQNQIEDKEQEAFKKAGIFELYDTHEEKNEVLNNIDARLDIVEAAQQDILNQKTAFLNKTDPLHAKAVSFLGNLYKSDTPENLRRAALLTATPDDDDLVRRLFKIDEEWDEQDEYLESYAEALKVAQQELSEAQKARTTFKNKGYASKQTLFKDNDMFKIFFGQFVTGILTNDHFWRFISQIIIQMISGGRGGYSGGRGSGHRRSRSSHRQRSRPSRSRSRGGFKTGGGF